MYTVVDLIANVAVSKTATFAISEFEGTRIEFLLIICNLFHGNKSFGDSNDQEIMKNAAELLLRYNLIFAKQL